MELTAAEQRIWEVAEQDFAKAWDTPEGRAQNHRKMAAQGIWYAITSCRLDGIRANSISAMQPHEIDALIEQLAPFAESLGHASDALCQGKVFWLTAA